MNLGFGELVLVLVIVLVLFGASRLPALGEGLGKAIRGFKDSMGGEPQEPGKPEQPKAEEPKAEQPKAEQPRKELPPDGGGQA